MIYGKKEDDKLNEYFEEFLDRNKEDAKLRINDPHLDLNIYFHDYQKEMIDQFWNLKIDWTSVHLETDKAPFSVTEYTQMAKLHFLFTMLNITQVFVVNLGVMVGVITKTSFIKHKTPSAKPIHITKNFTDEHTAANTLERKMIEAIKAQLKQMDEPRTPLQN